jgi:hypothetical protein
MILRNGKFSGKILRKIFHLTSLPWDLRLYFPSERKVCCGFLSPLKSIALARF